MLEVYGGGDDEDDFMVGMIRYIGNYCKNKSSREWILILFEDYGVWEECMWSLLEWRVGYLKKVFRENICKFI